MKINLNTPEHADTKEKLAKALATLSKVDPDGKILESLGIERELSTEDKDRIARAEAKRVRRAMRNKERD